ncbi:RNA polymerase sigma factor RpoE [Labilithrix luteola]|uniref:RNA polymerase sigma factor RpoE n=1 Tax=Labilithrix luteola TaxID=1391654 RepID=A0A0K1PMD0_9BACT|nr:RNA polymerase sigma factor [Labilithrix luteola]AKU94685.1 RNA polymerase sigma factor RpoE [Labilithrix luteola]
MPNDNGTSVRRPLSSPLRPIDSTANLDVATIVREHGPYVHRLLRRLGVAPADVDDAFQEVFVVVHRKLDSFEGRGPIRGWVYGICIRVGARHRRRRAARHEVSGAIDELAASGPTPEGTFRTLEARRLLDSFLDKLDDDKRSVFVLYELEGLPMQDVAVLTNCALPTAYSRLRIAREVVFDAIRRFQTQKDFK